MTRASFPPASRLRHRPHGPSAYVVAGPHVNGSAPSTLPARAYGRRFSLAALLWLALALLPAAPAGAEARAHILALGDSLTAGYGLAAADSFPTRLEAALRHAGQDVRVINAGVSGDTTAGGRARLGWTLADAPGYAIVALGANDVLRGVDPEESFRNLDAILTELRARDVRVLLAGMLAPPNLGREYGAAFNAIYPRLAKKHGVPLYPFFLAGVAANPVLNQNDGMHPNAKGIAVMVERILPHVLELVRNPRQ